NKLRCTCIKYNIRNIILAVNYKEGSVMILTCFPASKHSRLIINDGAMNLAPKKKILKEKVWLSGSDLQYFLHIG
uniref:Uncharacterized protein n=1 Tax=Cyprinodon variegatus TaxID=28743 RepID=A0A3Q2DNM6_CYPVA